MADKLNPKELNKPDRLHEVGWRIIGYILTHKKKVYGITGAVLGIMILAGAWYFYGNYTNLQAADAYSKAYVAYTAVQEESSDFQESEKYDNIIKLYEDVVKNYPRTGSALLARYEMGNIFFKLRQIDKAISAYEAFIQSAGQKNILTPLACSSLGYCYETQKNYQKALENFELANRKAAGKEMKALNYLNIARMYEQLKDSVKALEYYEKAAGENADPAVERLVKTKRTQLG